MVKLYNIYVAGHFPEGSAMKDRIYVCHTYYHVYVTFLKELKLREQRRAQGQEAGGASLVLSKMSNDFENLKERVESTGLFEVVIEFDEKREDYFPQLARWPAVPVPLCHQFLPVYPFPLSHTAFQWIRKKPVLQGTSCLCQFSLPLPVLLSIVSC